MSKIKQLQKSVQGFIAKSDSVDTLKQSLEDVIFTTFNIDIEILKNTGVFHNIRCKCDLN